ncbi:cytochrome P450 20A1-like [Tubulanus polymorphus]|uniref:cytochrome P450 20A1-like n=1 Tax=Tubulanus polymorphus TaxID=672921 RepID=UPI003DA4FAC4
MFDLMILFAVFVASIIAFCCFHKKAKWQSTVPGLKPSDPKEGNLADIAKAGSLHEFLLETHKKFGPIVSFWIRETMAISISTPELFSEHGTYFDRPPQMYKSFLPLIGAKSIVYTNGTEGRQRRKLYDSCYSHQEVNSLYPLFNEIVGELIEKWSAKVDGQHIPALSAMTALTLKSITRGSFGDYFKDEEQITAFTECFDTSWAKMEHTLSSVPPVPGSAEEKHFKSALGKLKSMVAEIVEYRRNNPATDGRRLLIDVILESDDDDQITSDSMTFFTGGFHTTASMMTWALFFLAENTDVQEKLFKELARTLDKNEDMTPDLIEEMPYLRQVIDETLRLAVISPTAARYKPDTDIMLGGYIVPQGTPVLHSFGVCFRDEKLYPQPQIFDPERFSKERVKARPTHAFEPFGFAGKRKCPGFRFTQSESYIYIARIIRYFEIKLVPDQVITPVYGMITRPNNEIWITIAERNE